MVKSDITTIITVKVRASAKEDKAEEWYEVDNQRILKAYIKQVPEQGRANEALIKLLSKKFKTPQKNIEILSGHRSSLKVVNIVGGI